MNSDKRFIVKFRYFSTYENTKENREEIVENIVYYKNKEALQSFIDEDEDYDDSQGMNFDAKSDLVETGRELISITEDKE